MTDVRRRRRMTAEPGSTARMMVEAAATTRGDRRIHSRSSVDSDLAPSLLRKRRGSSKCVTRLDFRNHVVAEMRSSVREHHDSVGAGDREVRVGVAAEGRLPVGAGRHELRARCAARLCRNLAIACPPWYSYGSGGT
jgi:hypothetical protein